MFSNTSKCSIYYGLFFAYVRNDNHIDLFFLVSLAFGLEISCSSTSIIAYKDVEIEPIECVDDATVHLDLGIRNLPYGFHFDGRILSGKIINTVVNHYIFVFNNETSVQISINGMF